MKKIFHLIAIALFQYGTYAGIVNGAELRLNSSSSFRSITIEGRIETGDYERFIKMIRDNQGNVSGVNLLSKGGDFNEAMKIGRALRDLDLTSQVPMQSSRKTPICERNFADEVVPKDPANCTAASAAFFIHIAATHKGGTYLAVHRPVIEPKLFGTLDENQAKLEFERLQVIARAYMSEMSVPNFIIEEVLNTPSDKILILEEKIIKTHFWGPSPYRQEWRKARCSKLNSQDTSELDQLRQQILSRTLSGSTFERYRELDSKHQEEVKCEIALAKDSRKEAFTKFFGQPPSDVDGHNFSRWLDANKYLGKTFEDLASEERFETGSTFMGTTSMEKKATTTSPHVIVMDEARRKRYVSWVNYIKQNTSDEFNQKLIATLSSVWGKPKNTDIKIAPVEWINSSFRAILKLEPKSADGPYISMIVENL
ncbi:hypothetical protein MCEMAEM4_02093 [Burkholderiaceae bacterium]